MNVNKQTTLEELMFFSKSMELRLVIGTYLDGSIELSINSDEIYTDNGYAFLHIQDDDKYTLPATEKDKWLQKLGKELYNELEEYFLGE